MSHWAQQIISLSPKKRGCHLVQNEIMQKMPEIRNIKVGLAHIFIMHTSASLTINENCDPDVRLDMEDFLNDLAPEGRAKRHTLEGPDDMPAHVKASLFGPSVSVPISNGNFVLGTWQGVWVCEHRNRAGARKLCITVQGSTK